MSELIKTVARLRTALAQARAAGSARVALVPTMGNLHAGHLSLVRNARKNSDFVVVSIFVNPLQFVPGDDYESYPRTLEQDFEVLATNHADIVYAPSVGQMYPQGESLTRVMVQGISQQLCGEYRPGHFTGVTTVVSMLFNQVQPDVAVFGEKDCQQLVLIKRMVADLHMPIDILGVPTARAPDGLALSSRNQYLSVGQRAHAPQLYASLQAAAMRLRAGDLNFAGMQEQGVACLQEAGFKPDYFALRTPELQVPDANTRQFVVLAAAWLGKARLIDNLWVDLDLA